MPARFRPGATAAWFQSTATPTVRVTVEHGGSPLLAGGRVAWHGDGEGYSTRTLPPDDPDLAALVRGVVAGTCPPWVLADFLEERDPERNATAARFLRWPDLVLVDSR